MVQAPFTADQFDVEPVAGENPRRINRAADGSLQFFDHLISGGITLSQLAGLRSVGNVLVVGKTGAGAEYTTIQAALDAVPANSSATNPHTVLVMPGVYGESVNLVRDYVHLIGFGAIIESAVEATPNGVGANHSITLQTALGTTPTKCVIEGFRITNSHDNFACVRVAGAAASTLGSVGVLIRNCNLRSTSGAGGFPIWATSVNHVTMQGGSLEGSGVNSLTLVEECASFTLDGVRDATGFQLDYDTGGTLPSVAGSGYHLINCDDLGASSTLVPVIASNLVGAGELRITGCNGAPTITMAGDQALNVIGSHVGNLNLGGTTDAILIGSRRGTLVGATATLAEPITRTNANFVAAATVAVAFGVDHPDANYDVSFELPSRPVNDETPWVTLKAVTGFTLNFQTAQTLDARVVITREM